MRHGRRAALVARRRGRRGAARARRRATGGARSSCSRAPRRTAPARGRLLAGERNPAALALDLVVVTPRLDAPLVERLVQRAKARRNAALVYVTERRDREPALLRLQDAGVAVAVVREGDDLTRALSAPALQDAAHA